MNMPRIPLSRYLLLVLLLCSAAPVPAASLTILPANPKGQEAVRLYADNFNGNAYVSSEIQVSMAANKIVVKLGAGVYFGGEGVPPLEISLGRFPAGNYQVELQIGSVGVGASQFTVSDENINRPAPFPLLDYTGLWWNPAESGWGLTITQENDKLFAAWYVYDPAGRAAWYTLQPGSWEIVAAGQPGLPLTNFAYTGPVYKTTGPYWANPFSPSSVSTTQVGTGKLTFTSYNQVRFDYTIEGITGSKNIVRFDF